MSTITLSGFFSGLDTGSIVEQITALNRIPVTELEDEQTNLSDQSSALGFIQSSLLTLQTKLSALNDTSAFSAKAASLSDTDVGTASVDTTARAGSVKIEVTQLATASKVTSGGTQAADFPLGTALATDVFGDDVEGTFTINNTQLTISSTTTLNDIVTMMEGVSGMDAATTLYNTADGKFTIGSTGDLVLGTSADTSSFLREAHLFNSNVTAGGPGKTVTSDTGVGRISTTTAVGSITNFGGIAGSISGDGTMTINGVAISYTTSESLDTILERINDSDAGVVATYDSYADKFILTAKTRGSSGISVVDTSGNLAQAMQLRTGTDTDVVLGNSTKFKVDDGAVRESDDATLTEDELGVTGLTFNPIATGTTTVTIGSDVDSIKTLIDDFVTQYNSVQNMIESYVKIDTEDLENSGILSTDQTLTFLPSDLRQTVMSVLNASGTIRMLEDLGIEGNSDDNTITVSDTTKLTDALEDHLDEVIDMFTHATTGLYAQLDPIIESYASSTAGSIEYRQESISDQQDRIDDEIERLEAQIEAERLYMESQFAAMESYTAESQSILQYLGVS
ncbi:MAG: flagellar filament capping protein FliD [Verrucomicrobiota bacterium]